MSRVAGVRRLGLAADDGVLALVDAGPAMLMTAALLADLVLLPTLLGGSGSGAAEPAPTDAA